MKKRSKEKREAVQVFKKLIWSSYLSYKMNGGGVGYHTKRLSKEDREKLKHLSAEDIEDRI